MVKIMWIIGGAILCAIIAFFIAGLIADNKKLKKENKKKEEEIKQNELNNEAKESMETGNSSADFNATIDVLSKLKGGK